MMGFFFTFCAFFPLFISNTSIVSINFGANLIKNFLGEFSPRPPIHAWYIGHTRGLQQLLSPSNIFSHRKVPFQKMRPHGKILKKGPVPGDYSCIFRNFSLSARANKCIKFTLEMSINRWRVFANNESCIVILYLKSCLYHKPWPGQGKCGAFTPLHFLRLAHFGQEFCN